MTVPVTGAQLEEGAGVVTGMDELAKNQPGDVAQVGTLAVGSLPLGSRVKEAVGSTAFPPPRLKLDVLLVLVELEVEEVVEELLVDEAEELKTTGLEFVVDVLVEEGLELVLEVVLVTLLADGDLTGTDELVLVDEELVEEVVEVGFDEVELDVDVEEVELLVGLTEGALDEGTMLVVEDTDELLLDGHTAAEVQVPPAASVVKI